MSCIVMYDKKVCSAYTIGIIDIFEVFVHITTVSGSLQELILTHIIYL